MAKRNIRSRKTTTQRPVRRQNPAAKPTEPAQETERLPIDSVAQPLIEAPAAVVEPPAPVSPPVSLTRDSGFGAGIVEPETAFRAEITGGRKLRSESLFGDVGDQARNARSDEGGRTVIDAGTSLRRGRRG